MSHHQPERIFSDDELCEMVRKMKLVSSDFYGQAVRTGNHAFIEFCGLMNKYIDICEATLRAGQDFTTANIHVGQSLKVERHDIEYLAEKFECIFGTTLADPEHRETFLQAMGWENEQA